MIVCISPSSLHYDETHNTLKYGNRAKEIKTKVSRNTLNFDRHVSQYVKLIYELRQEITELKDKSKSQTNNVEEGFKKAMERHRKLTEEAITQVRGGQERARANIEEMGNLRALISCIENAKKIVEGWLRRYQSAVGSRLPALFKVEADRKKSDADDLLKALTERHRNYISRLMFLQGGEGNVFEQSWKSALRMLANNGVDEFHIEYVRTEIRACKAAMERDAAIRQGLKMEEDTAHYVASLNGWIDANLNSLGELALNPDWAATDGDEGASISPAVQTLWDFTSKLFRFKAAKCLGQVEDSTKPFLSTASMLTPSRKSRFLAQFEGSPVVKSPRRSPRKFKVSTPKRTAPLSTRKRSPNKDRKKVRWNKEPPQEFQLPELPTPIPSPVFTMPQAPHPLLESVDADEGLDTNIANADSNRPILPLPLRKAKSSNFGSILKNNVVPSMQQFVTEFGAYQDESFVSTTSSTDENAPLTEIGQAGQSLLRTKASRSSDTDTVRGIKRRAAATSPGRAKRVFSGSSIGGKENGLPATGTRRASDSPVKSGPGAGSRRMTLGGAAARVTNPGWGSMGPPPTAPTVSAVRTASMGDRGSIGGAGKARGWR
jgi:FtsZ-binding cell division protein ZapB